MTLSMTGYGRGLQSTAEYVVTIDIKTINHRYLDLNFKIPKNFSYLEEPLRREISQTLSRGKADILINIESFIKSDLQIKLNHSAVEAYLTSINQLKNEYQLPGEIDLKTLISLPELFEETPVEDDQEQIIKITKEAMNEALQMLLNMRRNEGSKLADDLKNHTCYLQRLRSDISLQAPMVISSFKEKLSKRISELTDGIEIDPGRIAMEVAIFADKSDINEELVRIESHLEQFTTALNAKEPIGRRLDFIIQELNREINTIGSKANDLLIAQAVIEFKSELEKLREQVQNIE